MFTTFCNKFCLKWFICNHLGLLDTRQFKNIPEGEEVIIFSLLDNGEGSVFFSSLDTVTDSGNVKLPKSKLITKKEFSSFLASVQK